jgi:hypothetical protein
MVQSLPDDSNLLSDTGFPPYDLVFLRMKALQSYFRAAVSLAALPAAIGAKCARLTPCRQFHRRRGLLPLSSWKR